MIGNENWLTVGKLVAPQGLRGELRVQSYTDFPERFTKPGKRWLNKKEKTEPFEIDLLSGKKFPGKEIFIVRFGGINNRNTAESIVGASLLVPASHRPKLAENEFHLLDLLGLDVKLIKDGPVIGKVTDLTSAGNDLLEIQLQVGRKVLIPFVKAIVPLVKIKEGWLLITPPPGLLEL